MICANPEQALDSDLHAIRRRRGNSQREQFTDVDTFEGVATDPITLHKYLYANADPVNGIDPSGQFTVLEAVGVGAIVGGLVGGIGGVAYATVYKGAQFFSWETAKYAVAGVVGGAAIGALTGAAVFAASGGSAAGLVTTLRTGFQGYLAKWFGPAGTLSHPTTLTAAGLGFVVGVAYGWYNPSLPVGVAAATGTAATFVSDIVLRGVVADRHRLFPTIAAAGTATYVLHFINNYVLGSTFIAIGFGVGFTAGYGVGAGARTIYDSL